MESFEMILKNLGMALNIPLSPDKLGNCLIEFPDDTQVQIEFDKTKGRLLVFTVLGKLSPGAFQTTVLEKALIANNATPPLYGIFAYSDVKESLMLFEYIEATLSGAVIKEYIDSFTEKSRKWAEALGSGIISPDLLGDSSKASENKLFGL